MSSAALNKQSKVKKKKREREYKRIYPDHLLNPAKLKRHHSLRLCEQQGQLHIFNFCVFAPVAQIWKKKLQKISNCLLNVFFSFLIFILCCCYDDNTLDPRMLSYWVRQDGAEVFHQSCVHSSRTITSSSGRREGVIKPLVKEIIKGGAPRGLRGWYGVRRVDVVPAETAICFGEQIAALLVCS